MPAADGAPITTGSRGPVRAATTAVITLATEAAGIAEHEVVIDLLGLDTFPVVAASYSDLLERTVGE